MSLFVVTGAILALPERVTAAPTCASVHARLDGRGFDALDEIWREFGIKSKLFDFSHNARGDVQLSIERTDDDSGYTVIYVQDQQLTNAQLLVFRRSGTLCRYAGSIDIENWKHQPPNYRLYRRGNSAAWLVLSLEGAAGIGFYRRDEWWHTVSDHGVQFVLGFTARGYDGPIHSGEAALVRAFDSTVRLRARDEIDVVLTATYSGVGSSGDVRLFDATRSVRYGFNAKRDRLLRQPRGSSASSDYLEWLLADAFDVGPQPVVQGFLVHEFSELCRIAASGLPEQKAWIETFTSGVYGPDAERLRKCFR